VLSGKRALDEPLAGKSTPNRLELPGGAKRYHKIDYQPEKIDALLCELFLESHAAPPEQFVLDLDATDIPLHGHQPERSFMATTTATAICRCISSRAIRCCARDSGRPTRTRPRERSRRFSVS
jgi:hypothetical protein